MIIWSTLKGHSVQCQFETVIMEYTYSSVSIHIYSEFIFLE